MKRRAIMPSKSPRQVVESSRLSGESGSRADIDVGSGPTSGGGSALPGRAAAEAAASDPDGLDSCDPHAASSGSKRTAMAREVRALEIRRVHRESSRRVTTVPTPWVHVSLPLRTGCSDDAHLRPARDAHPSPTSLGSVNERGRARRVATGSVRPVVRPRPDACGARASGSDSRPSPAGRAWVVHPRPRRIGHRQRNGCRPVSSSAGCSLLRSVVRHQLTVAGERPENPCHGPAGTSSTARGHHSSRSARRRNSSGTERATRDPDA